MHTSKLKIKRSSVNGWRSLCWWLDLSDCLVTSSISQGRPQKKAVDHNCWDDGEARREDLGWQSEDVVWRRHWRQTGRGRRGTGVLGCADSWTPWGRAPVHWANVVRCVNKLSRYEPAALSRLPCWNSTVNHSQSLRQLTSWSLPCRPSGKSCHKNTSKRQLQNSPSTWLPVWLPTVVITSICSNFVRLQVCILILSPTSRLSSEPPKDSAEAMLKTLN